jgi:hypothetical protein
VTGRTRYSEVPNKLVEDGPWRYLLCLNCERRFSDWETEICEDIFVPFHEETQQRFRYGPTFCKFAVSVVWRWLMVFREEGGLTNFANEMPDKIVVAERAWREFLLDARPTPAPYDIHILPLDAIKHGDIEGLSPHLCRFMLRTEDATTMCRDGYGYIIVKMARLLVLGTVEPCSERNVWKATKIHASGGAFGIDNYRVPGWVFEYLAHGAWQLEQTMNELSTRQKQLTHDEVLKLMREDPESFAKSGNFKAFEADLRLFGNRAFQRPFSKEDKS